MTFVKRSFDAFNRTRQGRCKVCNAGEDSRGYPCWKHDDMRALYVRFGGKFERVGWLFEKCGHVELESEKYRMLVQKDENARRENRRRENF